MVDPRRLSAFEALIYLVLLVSLVPTSNDVATLAVVFTVCLCTGRLVRALLMLLALAAADGDLTPTRADPKHSPEAFDEAARADGWVGRVAVVPGVRAVALLRGGKTNPVLRVTTTVVRAGPGVWRAAIETARIRALSATASSTDMYASLLGFAGIGLTLWCLRGGATMVFTRHGYVEAAVVCVTVVRAPYIAWLRLRRGQRAATEAGIYVSAAQALADDSGVRALLDIRPQTRGGRIYVALTGGNGFHNDVRRRVIAALDSAKG